MIFIRMFFLMGTMRPSRTTDCLSVPLPACRGAEFILDHLRMHDVSCYWETLLTEFSQLLTYKPRRKSSYNQVVHRASKTEL